MAQMEERADLGTSLIRTRALWLVTACTALSLFGDSALYAVLPSRFDRFGLLVLQVGWLLSVNRLVRLPLNVPSGWLMRRVGPKGPFVVGLALGSLSTLGFAFFESFWILLGLRMLWGISWALIVVASYGFVFASSGSIRRGRAAGIYMAFTRFGGALGAMLGGLLLDTLGRLPSMSALAACGAAGALLALALPATPGTPPRGATAGIRRSMPGSLRWIQGLRTTDAALWIVILYNFVHLLVFSGIVYSTFGLYLRSSLGESLTIGGCAVGVATLTGALLFVRNLVALVTSPLAGALSDRSGRRAGALVAVEGLGGASLFLLAVGRSPVLLATGILIACLSYGVTPALLLAWLGDLSAGRSGSTIGGFQTAGDLGSGVGPLLAYPLIAWIGIHVTYGLAALLIVFTAALVLYVDRRRHAGSGVPA